MQDDVCVKQKLRKEQRYASLFNQFQMSKKEVSASKDRFKEYQRVILHETKVKTQQMRSQNLDNLANTKQEWKANKNYKGSLHKRERDRLWQFRRDMEEKRRLQNSNMAMSIKSSVDEQMYKTNTQRWQSILESNFKRKEFELQTLNSLSQFVTK